MLNAHPRIYCGPEVHLFREFHNEYLMDDPLRSLRFVSTASSLAGRDQLLVVMGRALVQLHEFAAARAGKTRWADKNPHNVLYLDDWQQVLGDRWLFVLMVRNPLDTVASLSTMNWPLTLRPRLAGAIEHYERYTAAGVAFAAAHRSRSYSLFYEDLVRSPELVLSDVMRWLGDSLDQTQLDFNSVAHAPGLEDKNVRSTTRAHDQSVGRWRDELTRREATEVAAATGDLWNRLNSDGGDRSPPQSEPVTLQREVDSEKLRPVTQRAVRSLRRRSRRLRHHRLQRRKAQAVVARASRLTRQI